MSPLRVAIVGFAVACLSACSLITSFNGLEATGGASTGGAGTGGAGARGATTTSGTGGAREDAQAHDARPRDAKAEAYADANAEVDANVAGDADAATVADATTEATPDADAGAVAADAHADADADASVEAEPDATADAAVQPIPDAGVDARAVGPTDAAADADATTVTPNDSGPTCTANTSTDSNNCGYCNHSCQGGTCVTGLCQPLTLAVTHGSVGIAVDNTYVYWVDTTDGGVLNKVSRTLTSEGTPVAVVSGTAAANAQGIAADGQYVYWTNKTATGQIHRALPTGGGLTTLVIGQNDPDWIASNGTLVAWTNEGTGDGGNTVMSVPVGSLAGATPTQLNTGDQGTTPAGIAIDTTSVYYATKNTGGGVVEAAALAGGSIRVLGSGSFVDVAVDTTNVYWTGGAETKTVYQNSKSATTGATAITIAAWPGLVCPLTIASDGTNVYFFDQGMTTCGPTGTGTGSLYRVPIGNANPNAAPVALVTGLTDPQGLALYDTSIYWVTGGATGAVMKLAK